MRFEYMYGLRSVVHGVYEASLLCLKPELKDAMKEAYEILKEEFGYVLNFVEQL